MGDILTFKQPNLKAKSKDLKTRAKAKTLCRHGFHKWKICQQQKFDVNSGKLITVYRCERCGTTKNKAV